MLRNFLE